MRAGRSCEGAWGMSFSSPGLRLESFPPPPRFWGLLIFDAICIGFKLFCDYADSLCWYIRGFFDVFCPGYFNAITVGFNRFWYFCMLYVAICVGFKHYSYAVVVICMGFKSYFFEVDVICMGFKGYSYDIIAIYMGF